MKNNTPRKIYLMFFLTGICGLIYQVLWVRLFGLVFGNTVFASSTVLAAYMGGLALGSFIAGKYLADRYNGLRLYAALEFFVGLFGAAMPFLIKLLSIVYTAIFQHLNSSYEMLTLVRFVLSFIVLMIPCTFMGATLPVLSKFITDADKEFDKIIGRLYGINTIGAVFGCFASGFILIGSVGITWTSLIAAFINLIVAYGAYSIFKKATYGSGEPLSAACSESAAPCPHTLNRACNSGSEAAPPGWVLLVCCGLSGFASIALEVGWTRALVWITGADAYAFAAMLTVILTGIGAGSLIFSKINKKITGDVRFLYLIQAAIGVFVLVSLFLIQGSFQINHTIEEAVNGSKIIFFIFKIFGAYTLSNLILSGVIFFIPAVLMGISFPLFALSYINLKTSVGKGMGDTYSVNTLGAILGSLAMGFIIIPLIGILPSVALMAAIYCLSAVLIILFLKPVAPRVKILYIGAICVVFVFLLLTANMDFKPFLKNTLGNETARTDEKLLYFKETVGGGVLVKESKYYGREMLIDGVQVASTGQHDLHSHLYPAHLMALLKKNIGDVLIVAFGAGGTSGSMLLYDDVKSMDVVEICSGVVEPAKKYFSKMNKDVLLDPKLNLIIQDGKNYMHMAKKKYDIIYSGPIHPQSNQGSAALYTREYFEDCKRNLKPGGFQCLWLPLHVAAPDDFRIIVKTFMEVYPHVTLWQMPQTDTSVSHPHLIGSNIEIRPDYEVISWKLKIPKVRDDLEMLGDTSFKEPYEFISQLAIGETNMRRWVANVNQLNTDDLPVVEYFKRPMNLFTAQKISKAFLLTDILRYMENPYPYIQNVPEDQKGELKKQLDRLLNGYKDLIQGHYFLTVKNFLNMDVNNYINYYYQRAFAKIPESSYLSGYMNNN